jgi:hypothetical protein
MNKLIFNEKQYVKDIVLKYDKNILDINLYQLIRLLAVYYYQELSMTDKKEMSKTINRDIEKFGFNSYYYELHYKTINKIINDVIKYDIKFKDVSSVPIYQDEYEIIKNCGSKKQQKLLATLYVMARWNNETSGWTGMKSRPQHIKKSANLTCTNRDVDLLYYDLYKDKFIDMTRKAGKFCYKMNFFEADKNKPVAIEFNSFDNIGNKFLASLDKEHLVCEKCGKLVKRTSPRMKYCKKCSQEIHREIDREYQKKKKK